MRISTLSATAILSCSALAACATAELAPAAAGVRVISETEAASCQFVDAVASNNTNTLSKDPQLDARTRAMNFVAERGGNALLIKTTNFQPSSSGIGGVFTLSGEAYRCP